MAVTLGRSPSIDVNAHADTDAVRYDIDPETNVITVYIEGQPGDLGFDAADGAPISGATWPILADSEFQLRVDAGPDRVAGMALYVATDAATTVRIFSEGD